MAQMELILSTPVEQLVPKLIAWNNAELLAEVKARLADYRGRVYDESSIVSAKADRATLNKFAQALDNERKRVKKVYMVPLDKFTAEVNEVIAEVNAVSVEIDAQVKLYDEKRQEEKLEEIKAYYAEIFPKSLALIVPYERIHQKEWLNASKSMTAVKKELDAILGKIHSDIAAIEAMGGEKEMTEEEIELKQIYFDTLDLATTLTTHERKKAEKQRILDAQAAEKKIPVEEEKTAPAPVSDGEAKQYSVSFKVTGTKEQLKVLSAFLQDNNYHYEKI